LDPLTTFSLIFAATMLLLLAEIEHRALVAMLAASLSVYFGVSYGLFGFRDVLEMLNMDIVLFIVSILIIFESISRSGLFDFIGLYLARKVGPNPLLGAALLVALTTIFSGISANIMVMLLMEGITVRLAEALGFDVKKVVTVECIQTNVGGILFPISSIPALIIASKTGMGFGDFLRVSLVLVVVLTAVAVLYLRTMVSSSSARDGDAGELGDPWSVVRDPRAMYKSLAIFVLFLVAIIFSEEIGLTPTFIAFFFATMIFMFSGLDPDETFRNVDWSIPFFVGGFFVFVESMERSGVLEKVAYAVAPLITGVSMPIGVSLLLLICAVVSAFIDNIPVVLLLLPIVERVATEAALNPTPFYWALIIGGNLGGSLTTFGSPSVLTGIRLLERRGMRISMGEYARIGLPLALAQIAAGMAFLAVAAALGLM